MLKRFARTHLSPADSQGIAVAIRASRPAEIGDEELPRHPCVIIGRVLAQFVAGKAIADARGDRLWQIPQARSSALEGDIEITGYLPYLVGMTSLRKWFLVVALSLILTASLVLRQHFSEVPEKLRPRPNGTIVSVFQGARAAGAIVEGDSTEEVLKQLMVGVKGAGSFSETTFQIPQLTSEEFDAVLRDFALIDGTFT